MVETMRMHPSLIVCGKDAETSPNRFIYYNIINLSSILITNKY